MINVIRILILKIFILKIKTKIFFLFTEFVLG